MSLKIDHVPKQHYEHFLASWSKIANIIPPAQMTITARTVPKFCAHIRAALPEIFFLDLVSLVISGTIEPWPECQPEETCFISLWARAGTQAPHMGPGRARAHPPIPLLPSYASLVCSTYWPLSLLWGLRDGRCHHAAGREYKSVPETGSLVTYVYIYIYIYI